MASSSSSHQQNQRFNDFSGIEPDCKRRKVSESSTLFDVFINHRGPDVKHGLATQLYNSLKEVGIRAFLDSEEKELGESFPSTIENAIKSAKVHIAIFSKRYAESAWCLTELVLMSQSKAKIIPVFYQVKPSDLRYIENGEYAKAFSEFENKRRYLEKLPQWKEALQSMSVVGGEEFNGDCKNIIAAVQREVKNKTPLHVAKHPVGLDKLVEDFQSRCLDDLVLDFENKCRLEKGKHKSKVVGIFGMGGCGKTTLAKELFNRKKVDYCRASFLFDVREAHVTGRLPSLQGKLLKDLFQNQTLNPTSTEEGMGYLEDHLQRSSDVSVLIVADDIDRVDQLDVLMIMEILNKFCNTLVIVTTRDGGVLTRAGISDVYNLKEMDRNNGRELFCWHAFNRPHSSNEYEMLVEAFVEVCGGLPLSLQVLGRHVHGKPDIFWRSALIQARKTLPDDVKHRLKISYDALSGDEKQIFMDIACLFIGQRKSIAERVWEGSGWNAQHSLDMLKDKCLVEETRSWDIYGAFKKPALRMHDHLRDLGREMAAELSSPLRFWRPQNLQYLGSMGLKNILAKSDLRCFHSMFDESMSCKVKFFVGQPYISVERATSVLWLKLVGTEELEFPGIPSWVSLQYVQCLIIKYGRFKTVWENRIQAPSQLKELKISFCSELEELSLAHLSCLEEILIEDCYDLKSVSGISNLRKLVQLNISRCPELEELRLEHLSCLKDISIDECSQLESVIINGCGEFNHLELINCQNLKTVSGNLEIEELTVRDCPELEELPTFSSRKLQNIMLPTRLFLQGIMISSSEKLRINMADIEELHVERYMVLCHRSNALIRNCIGNLKNVPRDSIVIGRAVGGAESALNKYLFSDADEVFHYGADEDFEDTDEEGEGLEEWIVIICYLVVVDSTTSLEDINQRINHHIDSIYSSYGRKSHSDIHLLHGEWIITNIGYVPTFLPGIQWCLMGHGITKKGFWMKVTKDQEWKTMQILHKIVDNLLEL